MAKQKQIEIETVKENGEKEIKKYTLQHPGIGWYLNTTDMSKGINGIPRQGYLYEEYLKTVVVDPVVRLSDFDEMENGFQVLSELVGECERFLTNSK